MNYRIELSIADVPRIGITSTQYYIGKLEGERERGGGEAGG
jgi:hypothetical protein